MHIELSVRDRSGSEHDLSVDVAPTTSVAELTAALQAALGPVAAGGWFLDGRPLDGTRSCAAAGVRTGVLLTATGAAPPGRRRVVVVGGPDTGTGVDLTSGPMLIGRADDADLVLTDPSVSRVHLELEDTERGVVVRDAGATHAGRLDGVPVGAAWAGWPVGALLRVGDSHLALLPRPATVRSEPPPPADGPDEPVGRPPAPAPAPMPELSPVPWSGVLGGVAGGAALAAVFGSPQLLAFAVLSPACLLLGAAGQRLARRRGARSRRRDIRAAGAASEARWRTTVRDELQRRRAAEPDAVELAELAAAGHRHAESRHRDDPHLLCVRVGLSDTTVMLTPPGGGTARAARLAGVPAVVDLAGGPLAVDAPPGLARGVARTLISRLALFVAPTELDIAIVCAGPVRDEWRWARWLPHVLGPPATTPAEAQRLAGQLAASAAANRPVVVIVDATGGEPPPVAAPARGAAVRLGPAPAGASTVLRAEGTSTRLVADGRTILAEPVSAEWADRFARSVASHADPAAVNGLPAHCTLADVHGRLATATVQRRWARGGDAARALLGRGPDGPVAVDLVADGPHALVAGTTGAGKSRLLRALVAGLAVEQPPDRLALVLVDFKGGAAFADCVDLPHVVGLVTDLDAALAGRALASLRAELRRREGILAAAGAPDLAAYVRSATASALPRIVVIVDEFATLADELPDFAAGLTTIAQRGRSLGLHLVLATQRPAGSVSAEVRANCSLRIALRTTDAADSLDVLDVADAANLPADRPGRAFVRSGGALRPVQIADTDAAGDGDAIRVTRLGRWREPVGSGPDGTRGEPTSRSQLGELVAAARAAASATGAATTAPPWQPPLPDDLPLSALPAASDGARVTLGLVDLPEQQRRAPLRLDLATGGSLLVAGSARSGRTTALHTLACAAAAQHEPDELHLHVVDFAGELSRQLEGMPQLGTVLGAADEIELAADLLEQLDAEVRRRRRDPDAAPRLVLLVDGWAQLVRAAESFDGGQVADQVLRLARDASGVGLTVAVAGDRSTLGARSAAVFGVRLLLRLHERSDYGLAGVPPSAVPRAMPPGRAVLVPDGSGAAAVQVQLARTAAPPSAGRHLRPAPGVLRVRALPRSLEVDELRALPSAGLLPLGIAAPCDEQVGLPLTPGGTVLVAGPAGSGRTMTLLVLLHQARRAGTGVVVAAPRRSPLRAGAERIGVVCLGPDDELSGVVTDSVTGADLVLLDDAETFADRAVEPALLERVRRTGNGRTTVVTARSSELASAYRGLPAELRRCRTGLLLRPERGDGELLGVRLPPQSREVPPGRGCLAGAAGWLETGRTSGVLRVQVARVDLP